MIFQPTVMATAEMAVSAFPRMCVSANMATLEQIVSWVSYLTVIAYILLSSLFLHFILRSMNQRNALGLRPGSDITIWEVKPHFPYIRGLQVCFHLPVSSIQVAYLASSVLREMLCGEIGGGWGGVFTDT